ISAVLRQQHPYVRLVRCRFQPCADTAYRVPMSFFPRPLAFEHPLAMLLAELPPWDIDRDAARAREPQQIVLAFAVRLTLPATHRAFLQRLRFVRDDETEVDIDDAAEAATSIAGADR